jgi:AraC-like DNA-binding protein
MNKVRAAVLDGFGEVVRQFGLDPLTLLGKANIHPSNMDSPDALIPASAFASLLEDAATATGCDHFGLLLSRQRNLDTFFVVVSMLMKSAPNLEAAINEWIKHRSIAKQGMLWELLKDIQVAYLTRHTELKEKGSTVQSRLLGVATCWRTMRSVSGNRWHPSMVCFSFSRPEDTLPYRRFFDAPVVFNADYDGIVFHSSDLALALSTQDDKLHDVLSSHATSLELPSSHNLRQSVKDLIEKNLDAGICNIESVVRFFPFERRTLQRKLSAQGISYLQLLSEVRYEKASHYLQNTDITMTRLAEILCYDDLSAFTKAFKNNTGQSPREWRKNHQRLGG